MTPDERAAEIVHSETMTYCMLIGDKGIYFSGIRSMIEIHIAQAVLEERDACAELATDIDGMTPAGNLIAGAIRKRGKL